MHILYMVWFRIDLLHCTALPPPPPNCSIESIYAVESGVRTTTTVCPVLTRGLSKRIICFLRNEFATEKHRLYDDPILLSVARM